MCNFQKAERLFPIIEVKDEIQKCLKNIDRQDKYEQVLEQANQIAREGEFQKAIDLLIPAVKSFVRSDGQQLLDKLRLVIRAKGLYQLGLVAEQKGQIKKAIVSYERALDLIPEYADCNLRLAIIAVKTNPQQAIKYLQEIDVEQAVYIRGYAYFQLGNWQEALKLWSRIKNSRVVVQHNNIQDLIKRDCLKIVQKIEELIDSKQLETAKSISLDFIKKHHDNSLVKSNLIDHIQPRLEHQVWQSKDWSKIAIKTEQIWLKRQDIKSLHNWAIATYYLAQVNSDKLIDLIMVWSTALANIEAKSCF